MSEDVKKIKDPIYGYIKVPVQYIAQIIDTNAFQRLRRIIQTSYAPLYPGAVHTRFAHSLGVYHLGVIVSDSLRSRLRDIKGLTVNVDKLVEVFVLACLLHDVGHAPFSHTGESYYVDSNNGYDELYLRLSELVGADDYAAYGKKAAPHEIMSAIIGLSRYSSIIGGLEERTFFSRCITGYFYTSDSVDAQIKNCLIGLLNSTVIDVDKLDYLIRDAYYTGHGTVQIDYQRLLSSITIVRCGNGHFETAFTKQAISVIENVVYAHDVERKWIQNHPTVLYESYIVEHMINKINRELNKGGKKLFSEASLTEDGQCFDGTHISLLSDDDVIFLAKKHLTTDPLIDEYFDRRQRRHPIWKSESEYKSYLLEMVGSGRVLDEFDKAIGLAAVYVSKNTENGVITPKTIEIVQNEIDGVDKSALDEADRDVQKREKTRILKVLRALLSYAQDNAIECSFVILKASHFDSGFGKVDFTDAKIFFDSNTIEKVGKVVSSLVAKGRERQNYFYIYYKRPDNMMLGIDKRSFCQYLLKNIGFDYAEKTKETGYGDK